MAHRNTRIGICFQNLESTIVVHLLLAKSNSLFDGNGELPVERIERLVWRQIETIKARGDVSVKLSHVMIQARQLTMYATSEADWVHQLSQ
jgi:hypothetical protein